MGSTLRPAQWVLSILLTLSALHALGCDEEGSAPAPTDIAQRPALSDSKQTAPRPPSDTSIRPPPRNGGDDGPGPEQIPAFLEQGISIPQATLRRATEVVRVSGVLEYPMYTEGVFQLDACRGTDPTTPPFTQLKITKPGPFTLYLPPSIGMIRISTFLDLAKNGPDRDDPRLAALPDTLEIKMEDIIGVKLVSEDVIDEFELSDNLPEPKSFQPENLDIDDDDAIFIEPASEE